MLRDVGVPVGVVVVVATAVIEVGPYYYWMLRVSSSSGRINTTYC